MSFESIQEMIETEAKKLAAKMQPEIKEGESLYKLGAKLFIRTVTFHYTGRIVYLSDKEVVLADAAWIADSGRFATALKTGGLNEVEPYPGLCSVSRDTIVDASLWDHDLPRAQK